MSDDHIDSVGRMFSINSWPELPVLKVLGS